MFRYSTKSRKVVPFLAAGALAGVLLTTNANRVNADKMDNTEVVQSNLDKVKQELAKAETEKKSAVEKLAVLEKEETDLKTLIQEANTNNEQLDKKYQELLEQKAQASSELQDIKSKLATLNGQISQKQTEIEAVEKQISNLSVSPKAQKRIKYLKIYIDDKENRIRQTEEKIKTCTLEADINRLKGQIKSFEEQIEEHKAEIKQLQSKVSNSKEYQQLNDQLETLKQELADLNKDLQISDDEEDTKQAKIAEINKELAGINPDDSQIAKLQEQLGEKSKQIFEAKSKISSLDQIIAAKTAEIENWKPEVPAKPEKEKPEQPEQSKDKPEKEEPKQPDNTSETPNINYVEPETTTIVDHQKTVVEPTKNKVKKPAKAKKTKNKLQIKVKKGKIFVKKNNHWQKVTNRKLVKLLQKAEVKSRGIAVITKKHKKFNLYNAKGKKMKQIVKSGQSYKTWAFKVINKKLMVRLGNQQQWLPAKYLKFK